MSFRIEQIKYSDSRLARSEYHRLELARTNYLGLICAMDADGTLSPSFHSDPRANPPIHNLNMEDLALRSPTFGLSYLLSNRNLFLGRHLTPHGCRIVSSEKFILGVSGADAHQLVPSNYVQLDKNHFLQEHKIEVALGLGEEYTQIDDFFWYIPEQYQSWVMNTMPVLERLTTAVLASFVEEGILPNDLESGYTPNLPDKNDTPIKIPFIPVQGNIASVCRKPSKKFGIANKDLEVLVTEALRERVETHNKSNPQDTINFDEIKVWIDANALNISKNRTSKREGIYGSLYVASQIYKQQYFDRPAVYAIGEDNPIPELADDIPDLVTELLPRGSILLVVITPNGTAIHDLEYQKKLSDLESQGKILLAINNPGRMPTSEQAHLATGLATNNTILRCHREYKEKLSKILTHS